MNPIFFGRIQGGEIKTVDHARFAAYLRTLEGRVVEIIVRTPRINRTNQQNRWYWACVVGIPAEHYGYVPEEMHEAYKMMFLLRKEPGKPETTRSTALLSTKEFSEYCERCRQWAAEQGIVIPSPDEIDFGTDEEGGANDGRAT